jgi:hypothetical protein
MGLIDQAINAANNNGDRKQIPLTLMTCQANGLCSFASGLLELREQPVSISAPLYLAADGLAYVFSDRTADLPGTDVPSRFAIDQADTINVAIKNGLTPGDPGAYDRLEIALVTWGGGLVIVNVVDDGQVLRGVGPAVGVPSGEAIYVVALGAPV